MRNLYAKCERHIWMVCQTKQGVPRKRPQSDIPFFPSTKALNQLRNFNLLYFTDISHLCVFEYASAFPPQIASILRGRRRNPTYFPKK